MKLWPGKPYPLGALWDGAGVNFSVFSENAERVELCLFDSSEGKESGISIFLRFALGSFMVTGYTDPTNPSKAIVSIRQNCC
jgi:pullulanase/glycogen debranching enzyme